MDNITIYLIKSIITSGLLTAYYWFFLRDKRFNNYNRFYLLSITIISLVIPLLNFNLYTIPQQNNTTVNIFRSLIILKSSNETVSRINWQLLITNASLLISFILLMLLLTKIIRIYAIKTRYAAVKIKGVYLIETELREAPFSFLNYLFWKKNIDFSSENGQLIFNHELAHIRQRHTYDKLFSQMVICIFWMNPFFRLIQKELNLIHEFIADAEAIKNNDELKFAQMLLQSHNDGRYLDPSHSFFHSPIKRRLIMITNSGSTPYYYLRRIFSLPLIALVLCMFSFTVTKSQTDSAAKYDSSKNRKYLDEKKANPFSEYGQQSHSFSKSEVKEIVDEIIRNPPADRIYYVNGVKTSPDKIKKLKYDKITDVQLLPPEDALKRKIFPEIGEKGIVSFLTKN
jgi:beta-lactamase regulating signal transducer with metallopeptidase domain